jgi:hypothetical protein
VPAHRAWGVAIAIGVFASVALGSSGANAQTRVMTYSPFDASGHVAVKIVARRPRAECDSGSPTVPRANVWRCVKGNGLYNACWKNPLARRLVTCVGSPWGGAHLLKVRRFGKHGRPSPYIPWALEAGGTRCTVIATGTSTSPYGRVNYGCEDGLVLYGDLLRQEPTWMSWAGYDLKKYRDAHLIPISVAWY